MLKIPTWVLTWVGAVPGRVVEAEAAAAQAAHMGAVVPAGDLQGVRAPTRRQVPEPVQHQILTHPTLPSTSTRVRLAHVYTCEECNATKIHWWRFNNGNLLSWNDGITLKLWIFYSFPLTSSYKAPYGHTHTRTHKLKHREKDRDRHEERERDRAKDRYRQRNLKT